MLNGLIHSDAWLCARHNSSSLPSPSLVVCIGMPERHIPGLTALAKGERVKYYYTHVDMYKGVFGRNHIGLLRRIS